MTEEEVKKVHADKVVDARGTSCPGPLLAVKRSITEVSIGGIMELVSSDTGTKMDVPRWAEKMGHEFLGIIAEAGYSRIFVKRMK